MIYHILNGDALAERFSETEIQGNIIVCRECLIEGPLDGSNLKKFYQTREKFINDTYNDEPIPGNSRNYNDYVAAEFNKILKIESDSLVFLWFEHDLFCQVNMWFIISLLYSSSSDLKIYRVLPFHTDPADLWKGFGDLSKEDLITSYNNKIKLSEGDVERGTRLWKSYKNNDLGKLVKLAAKESASFPYLAEVVNAHIERFGIDGKRGRPERVLENIINSGKKDFNSVFAEFWKTEGIYGFGDAQVRRIYDKLIQ